MFTNSWYYSVKALVRNNITSLPLDSETIISMIRQKGFLIVSFSSYTDVCIKKLTSKGIFVPSHTAFTVSVDGYRAVYYNSTLSSNEILFALAHEYGHICLSTSVFQGILGKCDDQEQASAQEREADLFALNLLAPICVLSKLRPKTIQEVQKITLLNSARAYEVYNNLKGSYIPSEDDMLARRQFSHFIYSYKLKKNKNILTIILLILLVFFNFTYGGKRNISTDKLHPLESHFFYNIHLKTAPIASQTTDTASAQVNEIFVVTPSGEKYHLPDCFHTKNSTYLRKVSIADALAEGLVPCKDCIDKK